MVVVKLAPLGGFQPAHPAKSWLKVISGQSVSFVAGPRPGRLHKNLWITLNSLLYSNGYRENYTEPVPIGWFFGILFCHPSVISYPAFPEKKNAGGNLPPA